MNEVARHETVSFRPSEAMEKAASSLVELRLRVGLKAHQERRLAEARQCYDDILDTEPNHATALHLLGLLNMQEGDIAVAARLMEKSVALAPHVAEAHSNLANALNRLGQPDAASVACRRAIEIQPELSAAHFNLGNALTQLGRLDEAIAAYRAAIERRAAYPEACFNLANALQQRGRLEEAIAAYRTAIALRPAHGESHDNLAQALLRAGRAEEAETAARTAILHKPDLATAHDALGQALARQGKPAEAADAFRQALAVEPTLRAAANHLAEVEAMAQRSGRVIPIDARRAATETSWQADVAIGDRLYAEEKFAEAAAAYARATRARPDLAEPYLKLSDSYAALTRYEDAVATLRDAIAIAPEHAAAHHKLADTLRVVGQLKEAGKAWQRAVELKPDMGAAHRMLAELNRFTGDDCDIAAMEAMLSDPAIDPMEAANLCFAVTAAYEDIGEYDRAFAFLDRANHLKRASVAYNPARDASIAERIKAVFTPEFLQSLSGRGCADARPVFIVGMPRSGTTLVEQILASHSHVLGGGETAALRDSVSGFAGGTLADALDMISSAAPAELQRAGQAYIDAALPTAAKARRCTDRRPLNFWHIGFIHLFLPNARIVHCRRNPADTCFACYRTSFIDGQYPFANDLADIGGYYRLYDDLMRHWQTVLPGRIFDVRYEDIVGNQQEETNRLLEYCGLPWENACMSYFRSERPVVSHAAIDVRQPIYRDALRRWKRYERHLGPLFEAFDPLVDG